MDTEVIAGVAPASNDADLLQAVHEAGRLAAAGPTSSVGLRNAAGRIYRVVYARGAAHALALTRLLEERGLIDDPCELDKSRSRCDAVYAPPGWHPSQRMRRMGA